MSNAAQKAPFSESLYRQIFDTVDEGVCVIEVLFDEQDRPHDYRFLEANPAFEQHTGIVGGIGKTMREFAPTHEQFWFDRYGQIARIGEAMRFEHTADALNRYYDVFAFRVGEPHEHRVAVLFNDISERKRQQQLLNFLIDRSPTGIYVVDADFRISHMNAASKEKAFRNVSPAIGRRLDEVIHILWPEPMAAEIIGHFHHTLNTGEPYHAPPLFGQRADVQATEAYDWQLERITMPDGRYAVACYYYDTTRLREVELSLREADRRKDEFLATLAHELRNPLAPLRNGLNVVRLGGVQRAGAELEMMERQLAHLTRLVEDLMEVSRITRGKVDLRNEPVDLTSVVLSAVETSKPVIEAAGHQLHISLTPLSVEGDPVRLSQVLTNLLNNAAKYTETGGEIWLDLRREEGCAVISVRDNGMGIPGDMLSKVFDLFAQADRTYERAQGGLGIGLTLVRRLVEMHGGSVHVKSAGPGKGSEFSVRLPLAKAPTDKPRPAPALADTSTTVAGKRVLVVDDNHDGAETLSKILTLLGAEVAIAHDGRTALESVVGFAPEIMLLDIGLPGMDGYEVARQVRQLPGGSGITLIAQTGWGQEEDRRRSREAGFDHHLVKPLDLDELQRILGAVAKK